MRVGLAPQYVGKRVCHVACLRANFCIAALVREPFARPASECAWVCGCCNRSICARSEFLRSSLPFSGAATVIMAGKVDVQGICATVTGYQHYVPCRICTAWVPRMELEPGLLPDETHHDAPTLMKFWTEEKERRTAMADEWRKAMLKGRMLLGGFRTQDCVSKKPAAASKEIKNPKTCRL